MVKTKRWLKSAILPKTCLIVVIVMWPLRLDADPPAKRPFGASSVNLTRSEVSKLTHLFDMLSRVVQVEYFKKGKVSDDTLVRYGIIDASRKGKAQLINNPSRWRASAKDVEASCLSVFNVKPPRRSTNNANFRGGYYYTHAGDPFEERLIKINSVEKNDRNSLLVGVSYYDENGEVSGKDRAIFDVVTKGKSERFVVVEYQPDR